jgi:hypothetical protein
MILILKKTSVYLGTYRYPSHHKIRTSRSLKPLTQAAQNELTGEATKRTRHAQDSALLMKFTEFYEYTGHETLLKYL